VSKTPILSIVIPTRNRQIYARYAIEAILSFQSEEFELIIHDNSDNNDLELAAIENRADSRLRYFYVSSRLSMVENFKLALEQAKGDYVCSIGDDDIVNAEIINVCKWAKSNSLDAVIDDWPIMYYWPHYGRLGQEHKGGRIVINRSSGEKKILSPERELHLCVLSGGVGMQRLPKVYLGLVRRTCLQTVLNQSTVDDIGTSLDMYFAVALASCVNSLCFVSYPIVIPGFSAAGAGQLIINKMHQGKIEDSFHLRARENHRWAECIPRFYSVETFFAESALCALVATARLDLIAKFNFPALYSFCLIKYPIWFRSIIKSIFFDWKNGNKGIIRYLIYYASFINKLIISLVKKRIDANNISLKKKTIAAEIMDVNNSKEAMCKLEQYFQENNITFDNR
jgi:glycosyltransferase involved in cell wall biosynthesis